MMKYNMRDFYIDRGNWRLCKVTANVLGLATAVTYDGETVTGRARRLSDGCWLVKKV